MSVPEPLALTVCRLCLGPADTTLRHRSRVGIGVRAALFADLIAQQRIVGARWPRTSPATGFGAEPVAAPSLADALYSAVGSRPQVRWRRWFSHVEADVAAATAGLITSGAWSRPDGRAITDLDPALTDRQADAARDLLLSAQSGRPLNPEQGVDERVVVLLSLGAGLQGGRPRPRAALSVLDKLLPADQSSPRWTSALIPEGVGLGGDSPGVSERTVLRTALRSALEAMRARAGSRFLSS